MAAASDGPCTCCSPSSPPTRSRSFAPRRSTRRPSRKEVFGDGTAAHRLPQVVAIPAYLILLGGTLWSARRMRGRPELRDRFWGTLVIAFGATIIAGFGSAFAALGYLVPFSLSLFVGICVMFLGFLRAARRLDRTDELTHPASR